MSVTSTTQAALQKDYHHHHVLLNRLKPSKSLVENVSNTTDNSHKSNDGIARNSSNHITSNSSNNLITPTMIVDNSTKQVTSTGDSLTSQTTTTTNVAMFVNNHHHYHLHHHQHHIHQHISINNGNNSSNTNNTNSDTTCSTPSCPSNNTNSSTNCSGGSGCLQNGNSNALSLKNNSAIILSSNPSNGVRKPYQGIDPSNISFSSASVADSIQDDNMSDQCSLTQAGLEEYNSRSYYDQAVFHHQKQSSYAQSEGYHSYVSSSDSSSATPFLDRLRQESELLSRQSHHWSQNDLTNSSNVSSNSPSNVNNDNNSSESTSSTETLKWLGSMSDVSVASHATNSSAISGSVSSSSQLIVHSSRVRTPKRQNSESVLYMNDDQMSVTSETSGVSSSSSKPTLYQPQILHHQHQSQIQLQNYHHSGSGTLMKPTTGGSGESPVSSPGSTTSIAPTSVTTVATTPTTPPSTALANSSYRSNHRLFPVSTYAEPVNGSSAINDYQSKQHQHHHNHHHHQYQSQPSPPQLHSQSQTPQPQQMPGIKLSPSQAQNWQSVADRINDFERQQQHLSVHQQSNVHKYTYIDPSKTHRVSNPTLKAFQKNAVQSYFERQQQNSKENSKNSSYSSVSSLSSTSPANSVNGNGVSNSPHQLQRPQSLQLPNAPKEVPMPQIRSSLPNDFGRSSISLKSSSSKQMINSSLIIPQMSEDSSYTDCGIPPPPPPRSRSLMPVRRSSSASDYSEFRENFTNSMEKTSVIGTVSSPEKSSFNDCGVPPPPPPPRGRTSMPVRRTSSASEYAAARDKNIQLTQNLSKDLLGPIIMGPIISVDDWVPERPPKNPHLRIPSPDLPPPPMQVVDPEVNLTNQDEPLPPPPPEILRHVRQSSETESPKPPSPSRRNSFAGSPSRKTVYQSSNYDSPPIPKKPSAAEILQSRPLSSLAQSHKAHKVILNGKLESPANVNGHHPTTPSTPVTPGAPQSPQTAAIYPGHGNSFESPRAADIRMSVRKRAHHTASPSPMSPDLKNGPSKPNVFNLKSPPPLKPRMPIAGQEMRASSVAINSKLRCNSKASYLPRQTRDKLNTTDPDHGSYKLTLTSNEDSINHNNTTSSYHDEILVTKCNNLPDVLPLGAKMQPSSPSSSASSPRYGSNNNIMASTTPPHTAPALIPTSYPMKSMFHFQPPVTTNHNRHSTTSSPSNNPPSYSMSQLSRSTSSPQNSSDSISPKYMSQSTIDLKKTHIIEPTNKQQSGKILSPAQSENNIYEKQTSPYTMKRDFQSVEVVRKLSLEERNSNEGRIVRAELVNTILSASPPRSDEKMIIRKDSLRENIEKITQLQSKLMSAHLSENSLLGYSTTRPSSLASSTATLNSVPEKETLMKSDQTTKSPSKTTNNSTKSNGNECHSPCSDKVTKSTTVTTATTTVATENDRISQMDSEVDGLKLMQRTEIVLRLNAPTSEVASQTDETLADELTRIKLGETKNDLNKSCDHRQPATSTTTRILSPRKPRPEEIDCDNFSKDLANQLSSSDKLQLILAPKIYKSTSDYVTGLYNPNVSISSNTFKTVSTKRDVGTSTPNDNNNHEKSIGCELDEITTNCVPLCPNLPIITSTTPTIDPHTPDSGYYSVTELKPKLVTRSSRTNEVGVDVIINGDNCDLVKKKEELVNRLTKKLSVLGVEQEAIAEECSANDMLGSDLTTKITEKLRPIDATKFRAYIDDVGHITMLLLSLSGRLAKAENTLHTMEENHAEKKILEVKRNRLLEQLEEAKRLKEDIDRRGIAVGKILEKHLSIDEFADYDYFINMKAKLIVDSRDVADKIKLSEEQLIAIKDTLVQSDC